MSKRLDILEKSLDKKNKIFDDKLQEHFDTVAQANGQPLNDKRNGAATLSKWDRQNEVLRNAKAEIEKTERAIEIERGKISDCEAVKIALPQVILEKLDDGALIQWRRYPNTFFVNGVDKGRIIWDLKKKVLAHRYFSSIPSAKQKKIFARIYNELHSETTGAAS